MYKLINKTDYYEDTKIKKDMDFLKENFNFDGMEIIRYNTKDLSLIKEDIIGYHLRFFPSIIDLYRENYDKLYEELDTKENIIKLCGGENKQELISFYKKELEMAHSLGAKYIVFHPCNIYIKESFHYNFYYSNMEILETMSDFLNEILDDKYDFEILLENLWWSGLRLDNYDEAKYLMDNIKYQNKGFMLDTGHMMNNNRNLKNSDEGIEYIIKSIENLKEYKNMIHGIHLNYSCSGKYVKEKIKEYENIENMKFEDILKEVYMHIYYIDSHKPMDNKKIRNVINMLPIKYLVYELICMNNDELIEAIKVQERSVFE